MRERQQQREGEGRLSLESDWERYLGSYDHRIRDITMIPKAIAARDELAENHRGFFVGCALCVVEKREHDTEKVKFYEAANYRPVDKPVPAEQKFCAERTAILSANSNKKGRMFIIGIVTVSSEIDTGEGGPVHDVLHPCPQCRDVLRHMIKEGTLSPESRICNVNDKDPEHKVISETTVGKLLDKYKELDRASALAQFQKDVELAFANYEKFIEVINAQTNQRIQNATTNFDNQPRAIEELEQERLAKFKNAKRNGALSVHIAYNSALERGANPKDLLRKLNINIDSTEVVGPEVFEKIFPSLKRYKSKVN